MWLQESAETKRIAVCFCWSLTSASGSGGHLCRIWAAPNPLKSGCLPSDANSCLLSEPGNSQVHARHHCEDRSHPYPSWPKPARPAGGEDRSYRAYHERAECGSGGPAVPPHLGRQKVHCGIGDIAQKDDVERRIDVPNGSADPGRFPPVRFMVSNRTVGDMMIHYGRVFITLWHT